MRTLSGTEIDGRYRLEEPVGRGGMATVWRARDLRLGRDVAVKLIAESRLSEPGFIERFEREARIAARLSHPGLVSIHDLGLGDQPYLVMELVEGETLEARYARDPAGVDTVELARKLLEVLAVIHDEDVVHRDVKPANVLYADDGRILLTDFGIARIIGSPAITATGEVIGTAKYMAPEVRDGEAPSPAADLYALGVLLSSCGAGKGPLHSLVRRLRHPNRDRRPANARLALVAIAGLTDRPAERGRTAEPARRPPAAVLDEPTPNPDAGSPEPADPVEPPPLPPLVSASRSGRSRALPVAAVILALIAVAAVAIASFAGSGTGDNGEAQQANRADRGNAADAGRAKARADARQKKNKDSGKKGAETAEPAAPPTGTATPAPAPEGPAPPDGPALNDQGYALIQQGDPAAAVPVLERAVAAFPEDSRDITYAYALFNLGTALRQSGRPDEAIPYLKQRLRFDDQKETVKAELDRAKAEAK